MDAATPGWYHAQGDPEGTERYWDGTAWTEGPRPIGGAGAAPLPPEAAVPETTMPDTGGVDAPDTSGFSTSTPGADVGDFGSPTPPADTSGFSTTTPGADAGAFGSIPPAAETTDFGAISPGPDAGGFGSPPPAGPGGFGTTTPSADAGTFGSVPPAAPAGFSSTTPSGPAGAPGGFPGAPTGAPSGPQGGFYPEESQAQTAVIVAIVGFVVCIAPGIAGGIMGHRERKAIDEGRRDPAGRGMATAAFVIGIASAVITALIILLFIIGFLAALSAA